MIEFSFRNVTLVGLPFIDCVAPSGELDDKIDAIVWCRIQIVSLEMTTGAETQRGRAIIPLKKLGGGDGGALIPPKYLENVLQIYNVKKDKIERERRRKTHVTVIDIQAYKHYPIPIYCATLSRLTQQTIVAVL